MSPLDFDAHAIITGNEVKFSGVDFENGSRPITVVKRTKDILVVKVPGRKCWAGNFMDRQYARAEFIVYRILQQQAPSTTRRVPKGTEQHLTVQRVIDFPVTGKASER